MGGRCELDGLYLAPVVSTFEKDALYDVAPPARTRTPPPGTRKCGTTSMPQQHSDGAPLKSRANFAWISKAAAALCPVDPMTLDAAAELSN